MFGNVVMSVWLTILYWTLLAVTALPFKFLADPNDAGQAKIAQFYADKILEADLGTAVELLTEDSRVVGAALNR